MNANRKILIDFRVNGKHDHYTGCDPDKFREYAKKKVKNHKDVERKREQRRKNSGKVANLCV